MGNKAPRLTDVGNGQRFAQQHRDHARYCYPLKTWFVCNSDGLWERCPGNLVPRLAKKTVATVYDEAQRKANAEQRIKLAAHAIKSENVQRLQAMLDLARTEPGIAISLDTLDADPWVFNVTNGVIDLKTGGLRPRRREDFLTKQSPVCFNQDATCDRWLKFLAHIFQGNQELINYLQKIVGYCLTGLTIEQALFLLWGAGANGKSTFLNVLLKLFGDYGLRVPADTFLVRPQDGRATPDLARLQGARLAMAIESDEGCRLAEATIKQMTGGDRIVARCLYQNYVEFAPTHKILFATNHKPWIRDNTYAMWRRIRLLPFEVQIPDDEQDPRLTEKLLAELPGILNWAIAGCLAWQHTGRLQTPDSVVAATGTYREEQDVLGDFLRERTVADKESVIQFLELREEYALWVKRTADHPMSPKAFAIALKERGFESTRKSNARYYKGLRLRTASDDLADAQKPVCVTRGEADVDLDD